MPTRHPFKLIENKHQLAPLLEDFIQQPFLFLDTEFERTRTFFAIPALIQISQGTDIALIDPTADGLDRVVGDLIARYTGTLVLHSGREDIELLLQMSGRVPALVFDTQSAAALCGMPRQLGYAALVEKLCAHKLDKQQTRSDWMHRPLTPAQLQYAADDVRWLPVLHDYLLRRLHCLERSSWQREECANLVQQMSRTTNPAERMQRVKGSSSLPACAQHVLLALIEWRESVARRSDRPRTWIAKDSELVTLARQTPATRTEVQRLATAGAVRRSAGEIAQIIARARRDAPAAPLFRDTRHPRHRETLAALKEAVARSASELGLEASVLATTAALSRISCTLCSGEVPELATGWRREFLAQAVRSLVKSDPADAEKMPDKADQGER